MRKPFFALLIPALLSVSGCTTVSNWFADEEELAIRTLKPINAEFEPRVLWQRDVGDGVDNYFSRLQPAVAYGRVYAADRHGRVMAVNPQDGDVIWQKNFALYSDGGVLSSLWSDGESAKIAGGLTTAYNNLYFGTENGDVFALDAATGERKWHAEVKGEVLASPAIDGEVVVVNTTSGTLYGLNALTGEQLWLMESDVPPLTLRGISAPAAANGGAIVGTETGRLRVSILESGQTAWESPVTSPSGATELERIVDVDSKPLVFAGTVYIVSFNGSLAAVELRSGRVLWNREYRSYRNVSLDNNRLFVVDTNSNIFGLDRRNGVELWSNSSLKGRTVTSATPVGEYVVVGDNFGYLHWLRQDDGQVVARLAVGDDDEDEAIFTGPVVNGNTVYTQTRDGKLVAIDTPN
ncbi:outer membrane protein assembly factor BamB [Aestuariibacter salexigens]|uniref:outer membrane protein assembly factor BamB n=1 Tax=Aestuariibacter salexigens TaxID=226010 RepID=UPI0004290A66|nr:outer membrane protein assembly factor BamB [Aestuariibacter salexigens]